MADICDHCGTSFEKTQATRRFCSKKCRSDFYNARQVWSERPDRDKRVQAMRDRYHSDPDAARERMRKWRANNPAAQKVIEKTRRERHGQKINARVRAWRQDNAEYVREQGRLQHAENREEANVGRKARYQNLKVTDHAKWKATMKTHAKQGRERYPWVSLVNGAKGRAKKKGVEFSITLDWARDRWTGKCELTGLPFGMEMPGVPGPKMFSPSIDRIVPEKGYTPDNCRFILWALNAFKGEGTDQTMYFLASSLLKTQQNQ